MWERLRQLQTALGVVIAVAGLGFVVAALVDQWDEATDAVADAAWAWLLLGLGLAVAAMVAIGLPWRQAVGAVGGPDVGWRQVLAWFLPGQLGKYVPGGVWTVVGRAELAARGVDRPTAYASTALSLATTNLGAALAAALVFPFALASEEGDAGSAWWVLLLLPLGLVVLHPKVVGLMVAAAARALRRPDLALVAPSWRVSVHLVLLHLPAWVLVAAATWCVARALDPSPPLSVVAFAALASWVAGMVVVPVPGGLGVREAVFAAVAATALPVGVAAAVALVARVVFMAADVAGVGLGAALRPRRPRGGRPTAPATSGATAGGSSPPGC